MKVLPNYLCSGGYLPQDDEQLDLDAQMDGIQKAKGYSLTTGRKLVGAAYNFMYGELPKQLMFISAANGLKAIAEVASVANTVSEADEARFGLAAGKEIRVTSEGIGMVQSHLSNPLLAVDAADAAMYGVKAGAMYPQNAMMVERLQVALEADQTISGADACFYLHELTESELMGGEYTQEAYTAAHSEALSAIGNSAFANYAPEVIEALPQLFNNQWRAFWGL